MLVINKGIAQDHKYASVKKPDNSRAILDMRYIAQPVRTDEIEASIETVHSQTCGKYAVHIGISYTEDGEFGSALKLSMTRKDRARISTPIKNVTKYSRPSQKTSFSRLSHEIEGSKLSRYSHVCARKMISPDDAVTVEAILHMIPSAWVWKL